MLNFVMPTEHCSVCCCVCCSDILAYTEFSDSYF